MKITMYELLGMVKDGKAPKTVKSEGHYYTYNELVKDYYEGMGYDYEYLLRNTSIDRLNDEVEILDDEEKGLPEKLPYYSLEKIQKAKSKNEWYEERVSLLEKRVEDLHIKMNDLLDYLEKQRKGE